MAQEKRKSLHSQLQAAFTGEDKHSLVLSRLLSRHRGSDSSTRSVSDAAIDCLGPRLSTLRQIAFQDSKLRCSRLTDYEVSRTEVIRQALFARQPNLVLRWIWRSGWE
jgi:hypothetical protein